MKKVTNKGVSLIVLVITIIIMIILASVIIISLTNDNIVGTAEEAVDKTEYNNALTAANIGVGEEYLRNDNPSLDDLEAAANEALEKNGYSHKYYATVTEDNVYLNYINKKGWVFNREKMTVSNGRYTLDVGDNIDYTVDGYTGAWKVLGATENGDLKIMSNKAVTSMSIGGMDVYNNYEKKLAEICAAYSNGKRTVKVRCPNEQDMKDLLGYETKNDRTYTYYWSEDGYPTYTGYKSGTLTNYHGNKFYDYVDGKVVEKTRPETITDENKIINTLLNTVTTHYLEKVDGASYTEFDITTKAGKFVFGEGDSEKYLLATKGMYNNTESIQYVVYLVFRENNSATSINNFLSIDSSGNTGKNSLPVRVVVELDKDISLNFNNATQKWEYN